MPPGVTAAKMNPEDMSVSVSRQELSTLPSQLNQSTDCTFIIGGEEIGAHKIVLTCCSPVFEKMLYGKLASNRIIITDISLEDFTQMLKFIYTNTVRIKSVLHAWSLFYVAHKYLLDNFANACVNYIQQNFNINNLILNYEYAEMYGIKKLQMICMNDIADYNVILKILVYQQKT
ncbi:hypothetical protein Zmor_014286 [Zophobas morio]|uniref:BTB domain-containing protein n=1 Tax=Zophobas morio TaxID=2755281 RepID=A0AA38MGB8_9CUCU|nr:hypothetical protein Zmor_014286 [Zophobas morio]